MGLAAKVAALHEALRSAGLPHAFGGALALAYCVHEPRATIDIDVNVFVGTDRADDVRSALPWTAAAGDPAHAQLSRDGQARFLWGETPVDLFLSTHPFHDQAAANVRRVPFGDGELPVLACADLAVFKAFFDRPKDALDVAAMVAVGAIDLDSLVDEVEALLGPGERRRFFGRVREFGLG